MPKFGDHSDSKLINVHPNLIKICGMLTKRWLCLQVTCSWLHTHSIYAYDGGMIGTIMGYYGMKQENLWIDHILNFLIIRRGNYGSC